MAINIVRDLTKFENLSYEQWYKLAQYMVNYDLILSDLEKLDELNLKKQQLLAYLNSNGKIPEEYVEPVKELNKKYSEVKKIQLELEISNYDNNYVSNKNYNIMKKLQSELNVSIFDNDKINKSKKQFLYFRNPFFIKGDNQMLDIRSSALKKELETMEWMIKEIKPRRKTNLRILKMFEGEVQRILKIPNYDIKPLFKFIRPYVDKILNTEDFYYSELLSLSLNN